MCTNNSAANGLGTTEFAESASDDGHSDTATHLAVGMSVGVMIVVVLASFAVVLVIVLAVKLQKNKSNTIRALPTKDTGRSRDCVSAEDTELNVANAVYESLSPADACDDTQSGGEEATEENSVERLTQSAPHTTPNVAYNTVLTLSNKHD